MSWNRQVLLVFADQERHQKTSHSRISIVRIDIHQITQTSLTFKYHTCSINIWDDIWHLCKNLHLSVGVSGSNSCFLMVFPSKDHHDQRERLEDHPGHPGVRHRRERPQRWWEIPHLCAAGGLFVGFGLGDSGVLTRKEWGENRKPWFWNAPEWKDGGMFLYVWWFESIVFVHL